MNYSELTDPELCMAVAKKWLPEKQHKFLHFRTCRHEGDYVEYLGSKYDPINNPSDAWPIIEEIWDELIFAEPSSLFRAETLWLETMRLYSCSKLRAAMICFLMMGDE